MPKCKKSDQLFLKRFANADVLPVLDMLEFG